MYTLSDYQIDFILRDIRRHGIHMESLQQNLLDHICIIIEQNLEADGDFEQFYAETIPTFYKQELREIEEETIFLLTHKKPYLLLSRNGFFILLFTVFIGPFIGYDLCWMAQAPQMNGFYLPAEIWAPTVVFSIFPLLVLLVLFLTPDRFDPIIPKRARVLLGVRPFITIVLDDGTGNGPKVSSGNNLDNRVPANY